MNIRREKKNGVEVCYVSGEINIDTVADIKKVFRKVMDDKEKKVILNLEHTDYIDSLGLSTLLAFYKGLEAYGACLALSNIVPKVSTIFRITKVDRVLCMYNTEKEAIESFK